MDITSLTVKEMRSKLDKKEISSPELTKAYLERIKNVDGKLESYITVTEEKAMAAAREARSKATSEADLAKLDAQLAFLAAQMAAIEKLKRHH